MPRVKRGVTARAAHKKVLNAAKGFRGRRKNVFRIANEAVMRAGQYAYRDRRNKKRDFRGLWIQRINAAVREHGLTYSQFIAGVKAANIDLDRKVMAAIAFDDPASFAALVEKARAGLAATFPDVDGQKPLNLVFEVPANLQPLQADGTRIVQVPDAQRAAPPRKRPFTERLGAGAPPPRWWL